MTDAHTHLLPCLDDGSRSVEESLSLLAELKKQGVSRVIATPHFYAEENNPERFLRKRQQAFERLVEAEPDVNEIMRLGAEVRYYRGIGKTECLRDFAIQGTEFLLVEMPFIDWPESVTAEVLEIAREQRLTVILAHVDRYLTKQNIALLDELSEEGVLFQANADSFTDRKRQKKMLSLLAQRKIRFIGSDCHNMNHRPPNIAPALSVIEKKLGADTVAWLEHNSHLFFREAVTP